MQSFIVWPSATWAVSTRAAPSRLPPSSMRLTCVWLMHTGVRWQNRAHFFAVSAQIMRRILVDFARTRQNLKRGGGARQVTLDEGLVVSPEGGADLLALDEALERLAILNPRQSRVVELRYFGGLNEEEAAEALDVSPRTVRHDWSVARAWLYRELSRGGSNDA